MNQQTNNSSMNEILPLFSSHYSICDAIFVLDEYDEEDGTPVIKDTKPVNAFAVAKKYNLERLFLVETEMSGFWEAYKTSAAKKIPFTFGLKLKVCADILDKTPESVKTESNVIIFAINSQGYYDLIKIFNRASTEGMFKTRRTDWKNLNEQITENLRVYIPFYSSFLAKNNLYFGRCCVPSFASFEPTFLLQRQGLPFDAALEKLVNNYCKDKYKVVEAHQSYYFKDEDIVPYQVLKCLNNRAANKGRAATFREPGLDHFGSDEFSFESYMRKIGKSL